MMGAKKEEKAYTFYTEEYKQSRKDISYSVVIVTEQNILMGGSYTYQNKGGL